MPDSGSGPVVSEAMVGAVEAALLEADVLAPDSLGVLADASVRREFSEWLAQKLVAALSVDRERPLANEESMRRFLT